MMTNHSWLLLWETTALMLLGCDSPAGDCVIQEPKVNTQVILLIPGMGLKPAVKIDIPCVVSWNSEWLKLKALAVILHQPF